MNVEIWSDVACPFCYIGKRHFEQALARFEHRDEVTVTWRAFQLDPDAPRNPEGDIYDMLAEKFGATRERAREMNRGVLDMAGEAGLSYDMDRVVPTNTWDAHRLIRMAADHGRQDDAEEALFRAYFSEGRHVGDPEVLVELGVSFGIPEDEVREMLAGDRFADAVAADIEDGSRLGLTGVPFFVIDRRFGLSGAQPVDAMVRTLEAARDELVG